MVDFNVTQQLSCGDSSKTSGKAYIYKQTSVLHSLFQTPVSELHQKKPKKGAHGLAVVAKSTGL